MKILNLLLLFFTTIGISYSQGFTNISNLLNLSSGYAFGEYGGGVSFVDFNQDGLDDLTFATGEGDSILFYINNGDGFDALPALVDNTSEVKQVIWVDYDNDGDLDLYATSHDKNRLYKNTGDLNLVDITETCGFNDPLEQSFCGSWLDYDEDGLLDLIISHRSSFLVGDIILYRNLGNDEFQDVTIAAGLGGLGNSVLAMATFDMNNDGLEDIYVGQDWDAGNLLLKNMGDGTFENISVSSNTAIQNNTMSCTIGDYNRDGWMDIYITNTEEGNSLLENQGDETFIEKAELMGVEIDKFCWGAIFLDADNDMDLDLHVSTTSKSYMFKNQGGGSIFSTTSISWGFGGDNNYSVGCASGDYNGDGRVDFAENNKSTHQHAFWKNNFTENNYITIDLQGTISNSMAVGAVIDVFAGGIHQIRRVGCGEGFSSQNSYSQFFGLGQNTLIDTITVKWPNGQDTILTQISANQRITIIETSIPGAGCTDPLSCNYDPLATSDNGSCVYAAPYFDCSGNCLNDADMDGICDEMEISGCMDITSCNFDPEATDDNGSCVFPETYYDCAGSCLNDADQDGVCDELEILGCMESSACNYDPEATDDDGSCVFPEMYYDCAGTCLNDADQDGVCDELEIAGCMDPMACNYNSSATDDDGSCSFIETFIISGAQNVEPFIPFVYTYPETAGSNYFWEVTGGELLSGQGTTTIEVAWNLEAVTSLAVTETNIAACEITATLEVDVSVDIKDLKKFHIQIYPNPVRDFLIIDLGDWSAEPVFIDLYDIVGKKILEQEGNASPFEINMQDIPSGVYQIVLRQGVERISSKIVVYKTP